MSLEETLQVLAGFAEPGGFDAPALKRSIESSGASVDMLLPLSHALTVGQLTPALWHGVTSASVPNDFTIAMGSLWDELVAAGLAAPVEGMPTSWTLEGLRLWAYTNEWQLISQDEDLMLMEEELMPWLLEIASERACPKRDYIITIVAHWARDAAFAAAGTAGFRDLVARIAQHAPAARNAGARFLSDYLHRLGEYAMPATVHREGALQRGLDLTRCHEPKRETLAIERDGKYWVVRLPTLPPKTIKIAQTDGRIRSISPPE